MRDLGILSAIIVFWFLLTVALTSYYSDPYVRGVSTIGNQSYVVDVSGDVNFTTENVPTGQANPKSYVDMLIRLFTFRMDTSTMPVIVGNFLSFLNWFLVLMLGLIMYRLIRHGGG